MEGAAKAELKHLDRAIYTAWHTALFVLNGYANKGKLAGNKSLSDILPSNRPDPSETNPSQAVAFFHRMKAAGMDVQIKRVVH